MTSKASPQLFKKITEVYDEMQRIGFAVKEAPSWVNQYPQREETNFAFRDWLQFVYLPNLLMESSSHYLINYRNNLVPQAIKFFGDNVKKGKLLQLLIELDALS